MRITFWHSNVNQSKQNYWDHVSEKFKQAAIEGRKENPSKNDEDYDSN